MLPSEAVTNPAVFKLLDLQFQLKAKIALSFLPWKAGNFFRGNFGITSKRICCPSSCLGPTNCADRQHCHYARLFEPMPLDDKGPSGFANLPRPFVFRVEHLNGRQFQPWDVFPLRMHLFGNVDTLPSIEKTMDSFDRVGLVDVKIAPVEISLAAQHCAELTVEFLTPLELKWQNQVLRQPHFPALISRIRDRVASLSEFYGDGAPTWDYKEIGERAESIRMVQCSVQSVDVERHSSRTGQTHGLGGFVGTARYEGDLGDMLPLLRCAEWTGVGRHTAWGNGAIRLL